MPSTNKTIVDFVANQQFGNLLYGKLVALSDGRPMVSVANSNDQPVVASAIDSAWATVVERRDEVIGSPVLLAVVEDRYVILGFVIEDVRDDTERRSVRNHVETDRETTRNERLELQAGKEIVLRCGDSEVTLRKDGKIIIKGHDLISRSTGKNRIKGATVSIN